MKIMYKINVLFILKCGLVLAIAHIIRYWLLTTHGSIFMFVPCINSIKTLFYYSKLMHTTTKS